MPAEADAEANGVGRRHGGDRNGNRADEEHGMRGCNSFGWARMCYCGGQNGSGCL